MSIIFFIYEFKFEIINLNKFVDLVNIILRMIDFNFVNILLATILKFVLFLQLVLSESKIFPHNGVWYLSSSFNRLLARLIAGIQNKALHILSIWKQKFILLIFRFQYFFAFHFTYLFLKFTIYIIFNLHFIHSCSSFDIYISILSFSLIILVVSIYQLFIQSVNYIYQYLIAEFCFFL